MDSKRRFSYSNLFNLEVIIDFFFFLFFPRPQVGVFLLSEIERGFSSSLAGFKILVGKHFFLFVV